jgi:kinesin family protein C1
VVGAIRTRITTAEEAAALVKRAASARAVEATAMNAVSSRSHSVFMLYICGHHAGSSSHLLGGLNLVDLAGRCTHISLLKTLTGSAYYWSHGGLDGGGY